MPDLPHSCTVTALFQEALPFFIQSAASLIFLASSSSGREKYFYSSLACGLVKFESTSPTNFLLAQQQITSY